MYNDKLAQEVLSSRLLNLWGQSTVYNFIISEEDELLGSVDFISPGQEFITCDDFGFCGMQTISGIRAQRIHLRRFFKNELDRTDEDVDNDIENILGDFLLAKVVRKHLLCDPDIKRIENLGVLIDGNQKKVSLAPHYDLEYSYAANTPSEDMYYQITMYSKWVPAFKEKFERLVGFLEKSLEVDESTGETQIERVVNDSNFDFHLEEKVKNLSLLRAKETVEFAKEKGFYNEEKGM